MTLIRRSRALEFCLLFLAIILFPSSIAAAAPREELLRFVPPDVGFCVVLQDLRGHSARFLDSDFVRHFLRSPLGEALGKDAEVQKLAQLEKIIEKRLGVDSARLRDEVLGDAVVFAYRPGPPGKPEQEQGMILLRARDAKLLASLVERVDQLQMQPGDQGQAEARMHNGRKYHRRGETYYHLNGSVLILSIHEGMLRQALDQDRTLGASEEPPVARQLRLLGADRQLASLWINPPIFTPEIEGKAARAAGAEASVLKHFLAYWKALEGIALTADMGREFEFSLAVRARTEQLPKAAQRLLEQSSRPADLWNRFPDNPLLAVAGRVDAAALLEVFQGFLSDESRRALCDFLDRNLGAALGKDRIKEVLPHLGPDWGLCVVAPPSGDKGWFPHVIVAVQVRPGDKGAAVDQGLLATVHSYALLAVVTHNRVHKSQLVLRSERQAGVEVRYLSGGETFPPGLQPAFALKDGYLLLGSSPAAIRSVGAAAPGLAGTPREVPLLRVSAREWRRFLTERREPLAAAAAEKNGISREEAARALDSMLPFIQLFDRLELSQKATAGQVTWTLRLQPIQPLRK